MFVRASVVGQHVAIVGDEATIVALHTALLAVESPRVQPAGSLTWNTVRIERGVPAGNELSDRYNPLEVGLWPAVSFSKGCYTGQEIIARMESRHQLAKLLVTITSTGALAGGASLLHDGRSVGEITSTASTPDGRHIGVAVIKRDHATPGTTLQIAEAAQAADNNDAVDGAAGDSVSVSGYAGIIPPFA